MDFIERIKELAVCTLQKVESELPSSYSNDAVEIYRTVEASFETGSVAIDGIVTGRYLRVINLDTEFLALAEIEVVEERLTVPAEEIQVPVQ